MRLALSACVAFACIVFLTVLAAPASGQDVMMVEEDATPQTRIGIGVRVNDVLDNLLALNDDSELGTAGALGIAILLPIDLNGVIRIEPELGFSSFSLNLEVDGEDDVESSANRVRLGLGVMALLQQPDLTFTAGGRVRYTRQSSEQPSFGFPDGGDDTDELVSSVLAIGPVVGGEYFFSRRFSLGAEAGLFYQSFGSEFNGEESDADVSTIQTTGSVFVRFFY